MNVCMHVMHTVDVCMHVHNILAKLHQIKVLPCKQKATLRLNG